MPDTLLSLGHGYSATALERILLSAGWTIYGTTRDPAKASDMAVRGIRPLMWNDTHGILSAIKNSRFILTSVAPDKDGDPVLARFGPVLTRQAAELNWVGYLSTTGVYGDHQGGWVDENTALAPTTQRGKYRAKAEKSWLNIPDLPVHIFRLAGIYGAERGPFSKVLSGKSRRIIKENQVFSRIHVDDIAQVIWASINKPNPKRIYNVCDDDPAPPQDVIAYAAELLGVDAPPAIPFENADLSPMAHSFYAESKRVCNNRIKDELGIRLRYPTYRIGLKAIQEAVST